MWDMYKRRTNTSINEVREEYSGDEVPAKFERALNKKSPARRKCLPQMLCLPFAGMFVVAVLIVSVAVLLYERSLGPWLLPQEAYWLGWQGGIVNGVSIQLLGIAYNKVAKWLTDLENHRTNRQYESALVQKVFLFQFLNQFSTIFMVQMFLRSNIEHITGLLISTLVTKQLTELVVDFLVPMLKTRYRRRLARQRLSQLQKRLADDEKRTLTAAHERSAVRRESGTFVMWSSDSVSDPTRHVRARPP